MLTSCFWAWQKNPAVAVSRRENDRPPDVRQSLTTQASQPDIAALLPGIWGERHSQKAG
jgi:hypothetical protein